MNGIFGLGEERKAEVKARLAPNKLYFHPRHSLKPCSPYLKI